MGSEKRASGTSVERCWPGLWPLSRWSFLEQQHNLALATAKPPCGWPCRPPPRLAPWGYSQPAQLEGGPRQGAKGSVWARGQQVQCKSSGTAGAQGSAGGSQRHFSFALLQGAGAAGWRAWAQAAAGAAAPEGGRCEEAGQERAWKRPREEKALSGQAGGWLHEQSSGPSTAEDAAGLGGAGQPAGGWGWESTAGVGCCFCLPRGFARALWVSCSAGMVLPLSVGCTQLQTAFVKPWMALVQCFCPACMCLPAVSQGLSGKWVLSLYVWQESPAGPRCPLAAGFPKSQECSSDCSGGLWSSLPSLGQLLCGCCCLLLGLPLRALLSVKLKSG